MPFKRIYLVFVFMVFLGCLLFGRLVYLQWVQGEELAVLGLLGRTQGVKLTTLRGDILDRSGQLLTNREERYNVTLFPRKYMDNDPNSLTVLAQKLGLAEAELEERIQKKPVPIQIADHITKETAQEIRALKQAGVVTAAVKDRYAGSLASHVIGYVNRADNIGESGIEMTYDSLLKTGDEEYIAALLDARHELIPGLEYRKLKLPQPGGKKGVMLTIDRRVQEAVESVMDSQVKKGAAVVMDPHSGEILAMVSRPNFDADHVEDYLNNMDAPLMNRAISPYQPGSIFKLVVAAAALENDVVSEGEVFTDPGYIDVNGVIMNAWDRHSGEREMNFTQALAYSSNPIFIEIGLELGMGKLAAFAQKSGFGKLTQIGLPGESEGNLPQTNDFYRGEVANFSIGQGQCEITPVQMAGFVSSIVADGKKITPRLVKQTSESVMEDQPEEVAARIFSQDTARKLRSMMAAVTEYGTGQAAFVENGGSAGKTGSAETGRVSKDGKGISHAWFAGYAPLKEPRYVVIVFIEEGMSGGDVAAPVFKEIVEKVESLR